MNHRTGAWAFGIFFLSLGVTGFMRDCMTLDGTLFGVFAVDEMLNFVHLICGAAAIAIAKGSPTHSREYFRVCGVVFMVLFLSGVVKGDTVLGLMTTNAADDILHFAIATISLWFGFGVGIPTQSTKIPAFAR